MEVRVVFHKTDTFAFDGMGNDDSWLVFYPFSFLKSSQDLVEVMAIYINGVPAKGLPLLAQRLEVHNVFGPTTELNSVAIYDCCQVIYSEVGGR